VGIVDILLHQKRILLDKGNIHLVLYSFHIQDHIPYKNKLRNAKNMFPLDIFDIVHHQVRNLLVDIIDIQSEIHQILYHIHIDNIEWILHQKYTNQSYKEDIILLHQRKIQHHMAHKNFGYYLVEILVHKKYIRMLHQKSIESLDMVDKFHHLQRMFQEHNIHNQFVRN